MRAFAMLAAVLPWACLAQPADPAMRTTCLMPQFAQEYYDRVTTATVKVIFEKILPAQAQLLPVRNALESAQQSLEACSQSCDAHHAALRAARERFEKVKAESDAAQVRAGSEITAATRRIRAEYAPCPEEKPND